MEVSVIMELVVEEDSLDLLPPVMFHMLVEDTLLEKQRRLLVLVNLANTDSLEPEVVEAEAATPAYEAAVASTRLQAVATPGVTVREACSGSQTTMLKPRPPPGWR